MVVKGSGPWKKDITIASVASLANLRTSSRVLSSDDNTGRSNLSLPDTFVRSHNNLGLDRELATLHWFRPICTSFFAY